jgi:hypothetical protein
MAAALTPETLAGITDINGTNFLEAANAAGYGGPDMATMLKGTRVAEGQVSHFVELHIEQVGFSQRLLKAVIITLEVFRFVDRSIAALS